ncbi:BTB/POZ domain-containing protein [Phthorimaea operculella]|nr:BTB/POZ domain-containing protein [Phthorimaea operculella]
MENTFTSSDSGLENTGLLESLSSHRDITLTDVSLTESTLHDLTADETVDSASSSFADKNYIQKNQITTQCNQSGTTSSEKDFNIPASNYSPKLKDNIGSKSSKEEKQRQNEEIVILESSSLSSETGSWESVFPPKNSENEKCEKNLSNERKDTGGRDAGNTPDPSSCTTHTSCLIQKSPFKSTSCFIDAASLVDIEDETIKVRTDSNEIQLNIRHDALPAPSQPLPCTTAKFDASPNDWSESNENEDSLEQADNKDPDSIQKDLSPEIFEMTPITEDSLCTNAFENATYDEERRHQLEERDDKEKQMMHGCENDSSFSTGTILLSGTTPHNSIMSLKVSSLKQYESEESESDTTVVGHDGHVNLKKSLMKYNESSPIVSGGASIEDHLPQMASHTGSPLTRRKIENIPIVSGAYTPQQVESIQRKSPKPSSAASWVVDMSHSPIKDEERNASSITSSSVKRPGDRTCELLRNGSKSSLDSCHSLDNNRSRSSVDSDGSEKSCHKFYIDLSSLPDPIPPKNKDCDKSIEKKNIFSMYIDLGEKPAKEMPARLSSSMTTRRITSDTKSSSKQQKNCKINVNELCAQDKNKFIDGNTSLCTFEKYESLCNDPNINISEIIELDEKPSTQTEITLKEGLSHAVTNKCLKLQSDIKSGQGQNCKAPVKVEKPVSEQSGDLFVKLSDLDKPIIKSELPATILEEKVLDERMTRSIPENKWKDQNNPGTSRSIEVISSFHSENALSLNRLFPHLKNEFSRSMPGSLSGRTRSPLRMGMPFSPGDIEDQASDASEMSSMQSSMCRSVVENSTTEDTSQTSSLIGNCQSRLGQDLLRMFLQEIAPDVVVEVSGRRIKAHKCILSSRCQYFAGILSGGWVESAGNVIVLPPFSYNVVHFALCHIYSGLSTIPDTISIVELATIADMLGLEGLKEAIMFTLKAKYCHHFHRPCQVCTAGVLECFPLSSVYGLDDLYRKCLSEFSRSHGVESTIRNLTF